MDPPTDRLIASQSGSVISVRLRTSRESSKQTLFYHFILLSHFTNAYPTFNQPKRFSCNALFCCDICKYTHIYRVVLIAFCIFVTITIVM